MRGQAMFMLSTTYREFAHLMFKENYSNMQIVDGNNSSYFCHKIILRGLIPDDILKDINNINLLWATPLLS